jgi:hypothetical protein
MRQAKGGEERREWRGKRGKRKGRGRREGGEGKGKRKGRGGGRRGGRGGNSCFFSTLAHTFSGGTPRSTKSYVLVLHRSFVLPN